MAGNAGAYEKINRILDGGSMKGSPATITGDRDVIFSYDKRIGWRLQNSMAWCVVTPVRPLPQSAPEGGSATTNRHIGVLMMVLEERGKQMIVVDYATGVPVEGRGL